MKKAPTGVAGPVERRGGEDQRARSRDTRKGNFLVILRVLMININNPLAQPVGRVNPPADQHHHRPESGGHDRHHH